MPRNSERSFCCGAGGARMWMEEKIGERINMNRTAEAVETGADQIAVGCPFCRVMLSDGLTSLQADGKAREEVEVLDVAQMLLASVQRPADPETEQATAEATAAEPTPGDVTQTEDTVTDHQDVGADAGASTEPDPEQEAAGGEPDPQDEASTEDQAGQGGDTAPASEPDSDPTKRDGA